MAKKEARTGTFKELLEGSSDDIQQIAHALRQVIMEVHPEAVEVVRLGYKAASYGIGEKKMSEAHTYIMPHANHVNLGFYYGALLEDSESLMEGTGKKLRHVKVRTVEEATSDGIKQLVEAALAERRAGQ